MMDNSENKSPEINLDSYRVMYNPEGLNVEYISKQKSKDGKNNVGTPSAPSNRESFVENPLNGRKSECKPKPKPKSNKDEFESSLVDEFKRDKKERKKQAG